LKYALYVPAVAGALIEKEDESVPLPILLKFVDELHDNVPEVPEILQPVDFQVIEFV
jgi:hypothetical protein